MTTTPETPKAARPTTVPMHPGHAITVTPGPFGRAFFDCGPGWHAVTPGDDKARATGAKWATVRIQFAKDAAHPTVQLVGCEPHTVMPQSIKHEENAS